MKPLIFTLLITLLLTSCTAYQPVVRTNYTPATEIECPQRPDYVFLFYEGQRPETEFYEIGRIEAFAHDSVNIGKIEAYLKYKARQICAEGVMDIKTTYEIRGVDTVTVLSGSAVKLQLQPDNMPPADTSFIKVVREDSRHRNELQVFEDKRSLTVVALGLLIIFAAIALL